MKSVRLVSLGLGLMFAACGADAAPDTTPSAPHDHEQDHDHALDESERESEPEAEAEVPSAAQVFDIFQVQCAVCHVSANLGDLQYSSPESMQAAFVNELAKNPLCTDKERVLVIPGDPDNSLLVQKLEGTQDCGTRMPSHIDMPADEVAVVRAWIEGGAPLN